jgi:hypothetical protein
MGEGGGGTDYETQGGGGGREIKGKEGWDGNGGAPCLVSLGGTCSWRWAVAREVHGNLEHGGHAGMRIMPAFETSSKILSSAKTFP